MYNILFNGILIKIEIINSSLYAQKSIFSVKNFIRMNVTKNSKSSDAVRRDVNTILGWWWWWKLHLGKYFLFLSFEITMFCEVNRKLNNRFQGKDMRNKCIAEIYF